MGLVSTTNLAAQPINPGENLEKNIRRGSTLAYQIITSVDRRHLPHPP